MKRYWIGIVALALVLLGVAGHAMERPTVQPGGGGVCWICRLLLDSRSD